MVMISPELILSKRFVKSVLRNSEIFPRILSIVIDEAHVVSHWGSDFRKKYGSLGILHALVPKGTPFVAMSATLSDRVRRDVLSKLEFKNGTFLDLAIGNDRSNVSLVVRAIQNPMNAFSDLDFLIPHGITDPQLGNATGYPGVFQSNPHLYPSKPVPAATGSGFDGYGLRVL